jgi:hypothetical protein
MASALPPTPSDTVRITDVDGIVASTVCAPSG